MIELSPLYYCNNNYFSTLLFPTHATEFVFVPTTAPVSTEEQTTTEIPMTTAAEMPITQPQMTTSGSLTPMGATSDATNPGGNGTSAAALPTFSTTDLTNINEADSGGLSSGDISAIVLSLMVIGVVLAVVTILVFYVQRRRKTFYQRSLGMYIILRAVDSEN